MDPTAESQADDAGPRTGGTVLWFAEDKGYGYITGDDGTPVFVHHADILGDGFRTLQAGARVTFQVSDDGRGPTARELDPAPPLPEG